MPNCRPTQTSHIVVEVHWLVDVGSTAVCRAYSLDCDDPSCTRLSVLSVRGHPFEGRSEPDSYATALTNCTAHAARPRSYLAASICILQAYAAGAAIPSVVHADGGVSRLVQWRLSPEGAPQLQSSQSGSQLLLLAVQLRRQHKGSW